MSDSPVAFHPLSFVPEGDEVVVGRVDTGSYAVLPVDGAELLRRLAGGMTPSEATTWYEATYDEQVDVDDFLSTVRELGFVLDAGAEKLAPSPGGVSLQRVGRALFSAPAWALYAGVVIAWLVVVVRHADVRPAPSQIFFTSSLIVVQLVIVFGQAPLLVVHEGFHILAGRRLGLPSTLSLSNRLTYIVVETKMNGLLSVPRRQRYLPFLVGMLADCLVLGLLGIVADLTRRPDGGFSLTGRVSLAFGFTVLMRLAWQFQLYLRTDLYFVFATAFNCYDLHDASKALLWNRVWRAIGRPARLVDEGQWTDRDRRVGTWYGPFLVLGVGTFVAITALGTAPVIVHYFSTAVGGLTSGRIDLLFWDAVGSLGMNALNVAAVVWLARRKRRQAPPARRQRPLAESALT